MKVEIIERKVIRHFIEVDENWKPEHRKDKAAANAHVKDAILNLGIDCLATEQVVCKHTLSIDGELVT